MTKIFNFVLKIKGGGREGSRCEVLRPYHPSKFGTCTKVNGYHKPRFGVENRLRESISEQFDSVACCM